MANPRVAHAVISGTVSLPAGQVAPAGGVIVGVYADNQNIPYDFASELVLIAEGESSVDYSLDVPPGGSASWLVIYDCFDCPGHLQYGYYAGSGTTYDSAQATLLPGGIDHTEKQLTLLTGNTIVGTVSLPDGEVAPPGGLGLSVYADDQNPPFASADGDVLFIAEGESSANYSLNVSPVVSASWRVSYDCFNCPDYLRSGYYADSGTTHDPAQATLLPGGVDHSDKDLTVLTGNIIAGTVSLPGGEVAPAGGLHVYFYAGNLNSIYYYSEKWVVIAEGESSVDYSLNVAPDGNADWLMNYWCGGCPGYISFGYYADGGATVDLDQATSLPGGVDHIGKDLTLLSMPVTYRLTVVKAGEESGTVVSAPAGIDCGTDCEEVFQQGTSVTLTAIPDADSGSRFTWQGCDSVENDQCMVLLFSDRDILLEFKSFCWPCLPSRGGWRTILQQ